MFETTQEFVGAVYERLAPSSGRCAQGRSLGGNELGLAMLAGHPTPEIPDANEELSAASGAILSEICIYHELLPCEIQRSQPQIDQPSWPRFNKIANRMPTNRLTTATREFVRHCLLKKVFWSTRVLSLLHWEGDFRENLTMPRTENRQRELGIGFREDT